MSLDLDQMRTLASIVQQQLRQRGANSLQWVNSPQIANGRITHEVGFGDGAKTREVSAQEALEIYQGKLDTVYAERLALAVCTAIAAVKAGADVALLQRQSEPTAPFDATGWLILAIEGHPMFHIKPTDLPVALANDAGLVTLVAPGSPEDQKYSFKNTTKVEELCLLLDLV